MNQPTKDIYKFKLETKETEQRYMWPHVSRILDLQLQDGVPVIWAEVYPKTVLRPYKIMRFLTGDTMYGTNVYLGTVQLPTGDVLHYYTGGPV